MKNWQRLIASRQVVRGLLVLSAAVLIFSAPARTQAWPDIFDPTQLMTMHLEMDSLDWVTVQNDLTFDIEVPAQFWIDGEDPILIAVRRKSCDALEESPDFLKVSLKLDINEYLPDQEWHNLRKLSLENGDDQDVVSEGFAWYLHHVANFSEGYDYSYSPAYASWIKLYINGYYTGVYVLCEQRDKQFLENRGLYISGVTWLYKVIGQNEERLEVGDGDSPAKLALCYPPFRYDSLGCYTPPHEILATELPLYIDMQAMLTMGAVNCFAQNKDDLFSHNQNTYYIDFLYGQERMYLPWDLDSPRNTGSTQIYPLGLAAYGDSILGVPEFRDQYTGIMYDLLDGPFTEENLFPFIGMAEALLSEALEADPNNALGGDPPSEFFDALRTWITDRRAEAYSQLDDPPTDAEIPDVEDVITLFSPAPNPCRTSTRINWAMSKEADISLQIFDVAGRLVATLVDGRKTAGIHGVVWNGRDRYENKVTSGVYFARIEAGQLSSVRKIVFLR